MCPAAVLLRMCGAPQEASSTTRTLRLLSNSSTDRCATHLAAACRVRDHEHGCACPLCPASRNLCILLMPCLLPRSTHVPVLLLRKLPICGSRCACMQQMGRAIAIGQNALLDDDGKANEMEGEQQQGSCIDAHMHVRMHLHMRICICICGTMHVHVLRCQSCHTRLLCSFRLLDLSTSQRTFRLQLRAAHAHAHTHMHSRRRLRFQSPTPLRLKRAQGRQSLSAAKRYDRVGCYWDGSSHRCGSHWFAL